MDQAAREFAIDPRNNVVLEASAGTGKTSVLVRRYLALLDAGVDPANILAITFTRKAAAEMRDRIVGELRRRAMQSADGQRQWRQLRDRLSDVAISTIDAFCLSLLGEFPLEAGLVPGFSVADETDVARMTEQGLSLGLRVLRARAGESQGARVLLSQVPRARLIRGVSRLVERRATAGDALCRVLHRGGPAHELEQATRECAARVAGALSSAPGGIGAFTIDRPAGSPRFDLLRADIETVTAGHAGAEQLRTALHYLRPYFLTEDGKPRARPAGARKSEFPSIGAWQRHTRALQFAAPAVAEACAALDRDTHVLLVRGVELFYRVSVESYRRALREQDAVDFTEALSRTVALLASMDEFAQSRYRLQSRYHHVLVDELQDTNRLQWRLVSLLVTAWGEGYGLVHEAPVPPSIFVVGDRKQSIYRFRDADVSILGDAAHFIASLRPGGSPRRSISRSFRARAALLAFVNDLCAPLASRGDRRDAFRYGDDDRFPIEDEDARGRSRPFDAPLLGLMTGGRDDALADTIAEEIATVLASAQVRDRDTGVTRAARPGDIAVLFRSRETHRVYEQAIGRRGIPTYVYKGLGFFNAEEILDLSALVRFLARPASALRVAAFLRSRFARLSDAALLALAEDLPGALTSTALPNAFARLAADDRETLTLARAAARRWLSRVDRVPPAELVDEILAETAYELELRGPRARQAYENVKKFRALIRRLQNRGYLTMPRLAEHLARLSAGDESNAIIDAADAVNLMTVHAAKGLEFPVVFVVSLARGSGGADRVRVVVDDGTGEPAVIVSGLTPAVEVREREAELEELKRLLYVAVTRARDLLYLATTLGADRRFRPAHGSLGEVLPREFVTFVESAREVRGREVRYWSGASGTAHAFVVANADSGGQL